MKINKWALGYAAGLAALTIYMSLDTFVFHDVYEQNATLSNSDMFENIEESKTEPVTKTELTKERGGNPERWESREKTEETGHRPPKPGGKNSKNGSNNEKDNTDKADKTDKSDKTDKTEKRLRKRRIYRPGRKIQIIREAQISG